MYRVVLVDDERLIVQGLTKVVPWGKLGCEVAGTAHDGISGLELIRKIQPDIIINGDDVQLEVKTEKNKYETISWEDMQYQVNAAIKKAANE